MIVDAIVKVLLTVFGGFIQLFPSWTLPDSMSSFGSGLGSALAQANGVFPVVTLGICIAAVMSTWAFLLLWDALVFVYTLIPFKAS